MHQLSGIDATFLNMETPTQQGHVGGVVIVDPSTAPGPWGFDAIRRLIEERIHLLPPFRRRLVTVPLEVDNPYWVDDADFDLDFHLRHIAVPHPGGRTELAELVARIHERPLDRTRPLWEMYVIEGLEGGRVATYTKLHHAAIDGVSGAEILTILLDPDPAGRPIEPAEAPWEGQAVPSPMSLLIRSAVRTALSPAHALRVGYELARSIPGLKPLQSLPALVGLGRDRDEFLSRPTLIAPRSLLNQPITPHRRWVFGEVSLETVKAIKTAADTTVNNVVISVSAGAVRTWMLEHGDLPERSLQALIPISIRTEEEQGEIGNKVSGMIAPIGTHLADPVERLDVRTPHDGDRPGDPPGDAGHDAAGLRPVRTAGHRRPGRPARLPERPGREMDAVQPRHLQRAGTATSRSTWPAPSSKATTRSPPSPTAPPSTSPSTATSASSASGSSPIATSYPTLATILDCIDEEVADLEAALS